MKILLPPLIFPSHEVIKIPLQSLIYTPSSDVIMISSPSVTSQLPFFRSVPINFFFSLCFVDRANYENGFLCSTEAELANFSCFFNEKRSMNGIAYWFNFQWPLGTVLTDSCELLKLIFLNVYGMNIKLKINFISKQFDIKTETIYKYLLNILLKL